MNINQMYLIVGYFSRELGSGMFGPDRFNQYCDLVNLKYYKKYLGIPEEYAKGQPLSIIAWQLTNAVSDRVRPFIVPQTAINRVNGYFAYPADYVTYSSTRLRYTYLNGNTTSVFNRRIEPLTDAELTSREESTLIPPILRRPVIAWTALGFQVLPETIDQMLLTYLRLPRTPFRAFTAGDVYDPTNSIQFEFPDICSQDIVYMLLSAAGISVQDAEVINYARTIEKEGV